MSLPQTTEKEKKTNDLTFDEPDSYSDIILEVEGKSFHCNKAVLSYASPVFARMFQGEFKEKDQSKIQLPEKKYDDFLSFLLCIYPSTQEEITGENVEAVLPLADEYQVKHLEIKCDKFIKNWISKSVEWINESDREQLVRYLLLAQRCRPNTDKLYKMAVNSIASKPWKYMKVNLEKAQVDDKIQFEIVALRVKKFEDSTFSEKYFQ